MRDRMELEELSRRSLGVQVRRINHLVHRYLRQQAAGAGSTEMRPAAEEQSEGTDVSFGKAVEYAVMALGLLCVYILDLLLFGPFAEYITGSVSGFGGVFALLARVIIPAAFLGVETWIALHMDEVRREERIEHGSLFVANAWLVGGMVMAFVMPCAAWLSAQAAGVATGVETPVLMFLVLGIISLIAHLLVLFGGRVVNDAKAYFAFVAVRHFRGWRAASGTKAEKLLRASANDAFIEYLQAWRRHNARYAEWPAGPFDRAVVAYLREQFPHVGAQGNIDEFASDEGGGA